MSESVLTSEDWQMRLSIYEYFVAHERPPTYDESAQHAGVTPAEARQVYHRLHAHHALFLTPGTDDIRIANPLSAVPTSYRVYTHGHQLWANCAWDSLGIPAMLHADARIEATYAHSGAQATYAITAGTLSGDDGIVHFPLPFRRWYDDLIDT